MSARSALADRPTSRTGRPRLWVAGLSLFAALVVCAAAAIVWRVVDDEPYRADLGDRPAATTVRAGAAAATMQGLVQAIEDADPVAAADLAPASDGEARAQLSAVVDNAAALDLTDVTARYLDEIGAVDADGAWSAAVDLTWAVQGFDPVPARAEVVVDFAAVGDEVVITGVGGDGRISPIWLRERLAVRRTPQAVVMAAGPEAERVAGDYLQRVNRAILVVREVLPQWRPAVVVEVPATAAELDDALDVADGTYSGIAAVTAGADGSGRADGPVRVFVNPAVTGRLRGAGAQVVISHELVHVATRAHVADLDPWLLEGFADYVALRDIDLPLSTTAARAAASVRRNGVPRELPGAAEFDTTAVDLEAAYEQAWLACVEVADLVGESGLVRAYEAAIDGASTADALARVGLTTDQVVQGWQRRLTGLVR